MGLSAEDVERWSATIQYEGRAVQQSDFGETISSCQTSHRCVEKPTGEGHPASAPFWAISKAMLQLQSNHLENGTICKNSEPFSFTLFSNLEENCWGFCLPLLAMLMEPTGLPA